MTTLCHTSTSCFTLKSMLQEYILINLKKADVLPVTPREIIVSRIKSAGCLGCGEDHKWIQCPKFRSQSAGHGCGIRELMGTYGITLWGGAEGVVMPSEQGVGAQRTAEGLLCIQGHRR